MSSAAEAEIEEEEAGDMCANCGITQVDDIKLAQCNGGCDLVKYCSDRCQENHREQHEGECKKRVDEIRDNIQRRAAELRQTFLRAELRDRDLFTMPDGSHLGECPICCLPLPIDDVGTVFMGCCCKILCKGCNYANQKREYEEGLEHRCAFCREPLTNSQEEVIKKIMKRIKENNDPAAMHQTGIRHYREGDYETTFKYWSKAAELGNADAHYNFRLCIVRDKV